jgi:N-acetylglucosaminyldiphosphoundecaprenol N-acetyl-beta-D-mannosaminyltransferase
MSLFFTLSGFLITTTLIQDPSVPAFLIRRLCRILPVAYLYVIICLLFLRADVASWIAHLGFVANYSTQLVPGWTSHFWSLCVEVHFYLFAAMLVMIGGARTLVLLPLVCLGVTGIRVYEGAHVSINTHLRVDEILAGAMLALFHCGSFGLCRRIVEHVPGYLWITLFLVSCHPASGPMNYVRPYLGAAVVGCTLWRRSILTPLLRSSAARYIAEISYALYLFHGFARVGWFAQGGTAARYLLKRPVGIAMTLLLAHASTRYFEKWWIGKGKKWSHRFRTIPCVEHAQVSTSVFENVRLMGLKFHALSETECTKLLLTRASKRSGGWIVTANLDHLRRLVTDHSYRELCAGADLVVADGMPLLWASRIQRTPLPQRVAGSDFIWSLSQAAASAGLGIYLLGGAPGTAEEAGRVLAGRYPGLRVCGTYCPPVGFEMDSSCVAQMRESLLAAKPAIVYVALGSPKQEQWISQLRPLLPEAWWIGVGISFSFVCGHVKRAPVWMQRCGIEWLHRLFQEPRRLFKRYIIHDLPFVLVLLGSAVRTRFFPSAALADAESPATSIG